MGECRSGAELPRGSSLCREEEEGGWDLSHWPTALDYLPAAGTVLGARCSCCLTVSSTLSTFLAMMGFLSPSPPPGWQTPAIAWCCAAEWWPQHLPNHQIYGVSVSTDFSGERCGGG